MSNGNAQSPHSSDSEGQTQIAQELNEWPPNSCFLWRKATVGDCQSEQQNGGEGLSVVCQSHPYHTATRTSKIIYPAFFPEGKKEMAEGLCLDK